MENYFKLLCSYQFLLRNNYKKNITAYTNVLNGKQKRIEVTEELLENTNMACLKSVTPAYLNTIKHAHIRHGNITQTQR